MRFCLPGESYPSALPSMIVAVARVLARPERVKCPVQILRCDGPSHPAGFEPHHSGLRRQPSRYPEDTGTEGRGHAGGLHLCNSGVRFLLFRCKWPVLPRPGARSLVTRARRQGPA